MAEPGKAGPKSKKVETARYRYRRRVVAYFGVANCNYGSIDVRVLPSLPDDVRRVGRADEVHCVSLVFYVLYVASTYFIVFNHIVGVYFVSVSYDIHCRAI